MKTQKKPTMKGSYYTRANRARHRRLGSTTSGTRNEKEVQQMKDQSVLTEIDGNTMPPEQQANIIESRLGSQTEHNEVRKHIVAKGYTEPVIDHDLLFASTPLFCILRILLTLALVCNWSVCTGDVSVGFLHAAAISYNLVMRPPHEFYNEENRHIMRRLNKDVYGLRPSPNTMARPHSARSHSHT